MSRSLLDHFNTIPDPRSGNNLRHKLIDILVITVTAIICNMDKWTDIEEFGEGRLEWFQSFLELPHGIPSHDTFGRVFAALDPIMVENCFADWVKDTHTLLQGEIVAIDGKTLRGSHDRANNKKALHTISAWASQQKVVLAQRAVDSKTNEITVVPDLLDMLDLKGCIVTLDAMSCQKDIAEKIIENQADYVLSLKGNHSSLHEDVSTFFCHALSSNFEGISHTYYKDLTKGHGRIETRRYWITDDIDFLPQKDQWEGMCSIGMVESKRETKGKISIEKRYFITSLPAEAKRFGEAVRQHWQIENELHWVLDVTFREDEARNRDGHSAQNLAVLRRLALNLLKNNPTSKKSSVRARRVRASFDVKYMMEVLASTKLND